MENDKLLSADERKRLIAALAARLGTTFDERFEVQWEVATNRELLIFAHRLGVVW